MSFDEGHAVNVFMSVSAGGFGVVNALMAKRQTNSLLCFFCPPRIEKRKLSCSCSALSPLSEQTNK